MFDTMTSAAILFPISGQKHLKVKLNFYLLKHEDLSFCHFVDQDRWVERLNALAAFLYLFHNIVATFEQFSRHGSNRDTKPQASSLFN